MAASPRELVLQTLNFEGPARAPRQLWWLPWAEIHHPDELSEIQNAFPPDMESVPGFLREAAYAKGDACEPGTFIDDWGAEFINIQRGVVGEVKNALIRDWTRDVEKVHVPREWLSVDTDQVNRFCAGSDRFILAGCCPRPFEQMQFLRGTADFYMDLLMQPPEMAAFLKIMHDFYCEQMELWTGTDVDGLMFMDDWGSQQSLLIDPALWRDVFKPLYRDYIQIAHGAGKKIFMHSDGYTLDIYPDMVGLGLDAFNTQLFCMGVENLEPFAGRITFWGEIDRQHLLPEGSTEDIRRAVENVHERLWKNGGCIAQCEFGAGARPGNVREVFAHWDRLTAR